MDVAYESGSVGNRQVPLEGSAYNDLLESFRLIKAFFVQIIAFIHGFVQLTNYT